MSRPPKPVTPQVPVVLNDEALAGANAALSTLAAADEAVINATSVLTMVGRLEGLEFVRRVADVATAQIFVQVKNSNKFKGLPYIAADGQRRHVADLDEFCEVFLKKSARRARELAANLHTLGPELYEQAERIGFRARDYQALKALPQDAQDAVKQVISSGDKEAAVDLLHDFADRVVVAEKKAEEAAETLEAKDRLLDEKNKKIDSLSSRKKFKPSEHGIAQTAEQQAQLQELHEATNGADVSFMRLAEVVSIVATSESAAMRGRATQAVQYLVARLAEVIDTHGIEVSLSEQLAQRPEWLDPAHPSFQG